jgi:23S rRNA (adenine2503-C2)-methyltransferase
MQIHRHLKVPTGDILVVEGKKGLLECLSLGDYGKAQNVKADFLGLTNEIEGVPHGSLVPLEEKWVVTISTQYGCSMNCTFCDVPKVGSGKNATTDDMIGQVITGLRIHPEVIRTDRLNIHFARMGEPTWNPDVLEAAEWFKNTLPRFGYQVHPVVSTMMPEKNTRLLWFLLEWMTIKNSTYNGEAGLQLSINSTDEAQRHKMFSGNASSMHRCAATMQYVIKHRGVKGRKIALNFAIADDTIIDAEYLAALFDPQYFMCKLTPMHVTQACEDNKIQTTKGYTAFTPYKKHEEALKAAGFDVLVFVPSWEEDAGRITCGNAILSGTEPECEWSEINDRP